MNKEYYIVLVLVLVIIAALAVVQLASVEETVIAATCSNDSGQSRIALPEPAFKGKILEDAISERRSGRNFSSEKISLSELSMLLWAGSGITSEQGLRSAPSAGALYPIDIYVVPNRVGGASCGVYRYLPKNHELVLVKEGKFAGRFYNISYGQSHVGNAALLMVLVSTPARTTSKYGEIGAEYVLIEVGHIAQNILLEANSIGVESVPVGGFDREQTDTILGLDSEKEAIYIIAAGK
jgi:SagB-type dehydrogenase family enzyme